jgi:hypothetical protein
MGGGAVFGRPAPARWRPTKYGVILPLPTALGACQGANNLQLPFEIAPANDLSEKFHACVSRETAEVVRRVSSRGLVALIARHDEMNRDVAAACKAEGRILKPDEISFVAREIDKEVEAKRAEKSVGSTR